MNEENRIREFILENFMTGQNKENLGNKDSLLDKGIIDSMSMLELIAFVEETYDMEIDDDEVTPDNFDSISKLAAYIGKKAKLEQK